MPVFERLAGFPAGIHAALTLRGGAGEGASVAPYTAFNLATHVGDDPSAVTTNRSHLTESVCAEPFWLTQVHGTRVVTIEEDAYRLAPPEADGSLTSQPGLACAILVADCLPVLVARADGGLVGAAHAGWRGLSGGVLPTLLEAMHMHDPEAARQGIHLWLGPCIGPSQFEVGPEVQTAFAQSAAFYDVNVKPFFRPGQADRLLADLSGLARAQCLAWAQRADVPIRHVQQDRRCTVTDATHFYSYRREGRTGRMAAMIWRKPEDSSRVFI
jgi:hypothetical protein